MELDLTHHTLREAMRVHVCLVQHLQGYLFARCPVPGAVDAPEAPATNDLMVGRRGRREEGGGQSMGEEGGRRGGGGGKRGIIKTYLADVKLLDALGMLQLHGGVCPCGWKCGTVCRRSEGGKRRGREKR